MLNSLFTDDESTFVQDEPALELALPQVFEQPALTVIQRGNLRNVEWLVAKLQRTHLSQGGTGPLGQDYQALVNEFQPLLNWANASWDFLLSTEGCRFIHRHTEERSFYRSDYRAVAHKDFSRLAHKVFRQCILEFAQTPVAQSLGGFLRERFWPSIRETYQQLNVPADPRQRPLTGYSYLRCIPYRFFNPIHQQLVDGTLGALARLERQALDGYFLQFETVPATAEALQLPQGLTEEHLRRGLTTLLLKQRLVYCLLRQIERY